MKTVNRLVIDSRKNECSLNGIELELLTGMSINITHDDRIHAVLELDIDEARVDVECDGQIQWKEKQWLPTRWADGNVLVTKKLFQKIKSFICYPK